MKRSVLFAFVPVFALSCSQMKQQANSLENSVALTWSFQGNFPDERCYHAAFNLKNLGDSALTDQGWALYYNQQGRGVIDASVTGNVKIEHMNGDLMKITPQTGFLLDPGDSMEISYRKRGTLFLQAEAPLHPYMVYDRGIESPAAISIDQYSILPFPSLERIYPEEMGIPLPNAEWVYEQNRPGSLLEPGETGSVIPTPVKEVYGGDVLTLAENVQVYYQEGLANEAGYLSELMKELTGQEPGTAVGKADTPGMISLLTDNQINGPEAYRLVVSKEDGVVITGSDEAGVFYGIQTFLSLCPPEAWGHPGTLLELPSVSVEDNPAFSYRGFHLDIARNFIEPGDIKKLIRAMAYYKLNRLHLHLTDDEGWRIEIPSLPELTEVGAYRGYTISERDHLIPAYGSGPDPYADDNHGSGYLSREDFIDLLKFAASHHIEVIPEVNMPGHSRAAIYSMESRYDRLMKEGRKEEAEKYRLIDPDDVSRYNSAQNFDDNVVCVCTEGPYRLFETVVDELIAMYQEAGLTLKVLHTGGDEVPSGVWEGSPICQAFMEEHPEIGNVENLQAYCGSRLFEILERKGLVMAGWEEIVMKKDEDGRWIPNKEFVGKEMLPYVWNSIYGNLDLGNRLANAGFPVVLCNVNNFYFDLAYTHHPAEPGQYWGGFVKTRSAYDFTPFDVFKCNLADRWGHPYDPETDFKGMERLRQEAYSRILGLQAELWSETVKGGTMAEYYYLPKLIGFAERAWAGQSSWATIADQETMIAARDKDWNRFANMVGHREMPRLDYLHGGYAYRLPPPGGIIREGMLYANIDFPGLTIRYTTDGSDPGAGSPVYIEPVEVTGDVKLCSFDTRGRKSRISYVGSD